MEDSGPGISPAIQTRLGEPFFTTKPPGVGTGLRLSLYQGIIADHGGTFSVESPEEAGAIFRATFPVTAAPRPTPDITALAVPPPMTGKELLVIDDEAATVKALVAVFRRDGHTVDTAANGGQAIEKLQTRSYDLLVCDLHMPGLDGPCLYRALAQTHPHLLSRFIIMTGDTLSPETQAFLKASGVPSLAKPLRIVELQRVVRHTLQRLIAADACRARIAAPPSPQSIHHAPAAGGSQAGLSTMPPVERFPTPTTAIVMETAPCRTRWLRRPGGKHD